MNNLFQQLQGQQQILPMSPAQLNQKLPILKNNLNSLKSLKTFLNGSASPETLVQTMIQNNPELQSILQLFQNSNKTPKQFFQDYTGLDPDQIKDFIK